MKRKGHIEKKRREKKHGEMDIHREREIVLELMKVRVRARIGMAVVHQWMDGWVNWEDSCRIIPREKSYFFPCQISCDSLWIH